MGIVNRNMVLPHSEIHESRTLSREPKLKMKVHKIHNSLVTSWVHLASSLCTIGYKLVVANAIMKMYSIAVAMLDVILPLKDCINENRLNF